MPPIPEAIAWARRAEAWAQRSDAEQDGQVVPSRWSEAAAPGRTAFPEDHVGWRTETAEWRAIGHTARWRQTTEWHSASGTHGWRSTTEAWETGGERFQPPPDPQTRQQPAISGTAWPAPDDEGTTSDATPMWQQPPEGGQAVDAGSRQQLTDGPWQPDADPRPAWQQFAGPPAPWGQPARPPGDPSGQGAAPGPGERPEGTSAWQQPVEPGARFAIEGESTRSVPFDDGRHLVRDDDRARWRREAAGQEHDARSVGRRRADDDSGPGSSGGTGWSTRPDSEHPGDARPSEESAATLWASRSEPPSWSSGVISSSGRAPVTGGATESTRRSPGGDSAGWPARPPTESGSWSSGAGPAGTTWSSNASRTGSWSPDPGAGSTNTANWSPDPGAGSTGTAPWSPHVDAAATGTAPWSPGGAATEPRQDSDTGTAWSAGGADDAATGWSDGARAYGRAPAWPADNPGQPNGSTDAWRPDDHGRTRGSAPAWPASNPDQANGTTPARHADDPGQANGSTPGWHADNPGQANGSTPGWRSDDRGRATGRAPAWPSDEARAGAAGWGQSSGPAAGGWRESGADHGGDAGTRWRHSDAHQPDTDWRHDSTEHTDWRDHSREETDWQDDSRGKTDWHDDSRVQADWGQGSLDEAGWSQSEPRRRRDRRDRPGWQRDDGSWREPGTETVRRRHAAAPADPWAQNSADTGMIPMTWQPPEADTGSWRSGASAVGRARPTNPNRRRADGIRPSDTGTRLGGSRRAEPGGEHEAPLDPEVWRRDPQSHTAGANWPVEPSDVDWRHDPRGGPAVGEAVTEIRQRTEPGAWQDEAARGAASYREHSTGDWRRALAAESGELVEGESRRFGTQDFVPFQAIGSASVPAPQGSVADPAASVVRERWEDAADNVWPVRQPTGNHHPGGSYERRPVGGGLPTMSGRSGNLLEPDEDEFEEDTGGLLAAVGYTVIWYGVPVVLFILYMLVLNGSQQAHALSTLAKAAPQFGLSLLLSMVVAVGLRWASGSWKAASVGLAAAVMGGGLATVLSSAITGNSLS